MKAMLLGGSRLKILQDPLQQQQVLFLTMLWDSLQGPWHADPSQGLLHFLVRRSCRDPGEVSLQCMLLYGSL